MAGRDNTCADLLSKIQKDLEAVSVTVETGVDYRANQIQVINSNSLKERAVLETETE